MALFQALAYSVLALVTLFAGIVALGVVLRLIRRGPGSAAEAVARGESLGRWWRAEHVPPTAGARLDQRLALAGRRTRALGTVMTEERASQPSYGR